MSSSKIASKIGAFFKNFWAKNKLLSILLLAIMVCLIVVLPIISAVADKTSGDYYLNNFDGVKGNFFRTNERIKLEKGNKFTFYNNNGTIRVISGEVYKGKYTKLNGGICLIVGDNQGDYFADSNFYVKHKNYLVDLNAATTIRQVSNSVYTAKNKVEGFYNFGATRVLLKKGKVYTSIDNSNSNESFTKASGKYSVKGDILTYSGTDEISTQFLVFNFVNTRGEQNKALALTFYSKGKVKSKTPSITATALKDELFKKQDDNLYQPVLLKYPSKKTLNYQSLEIVNDLTTNFDATIDGGKIRASGTGIITVKFVVNSDVSYNQTFEIVDMSFKEPLPVITEKTTVTISSLLSNTADFYHAESTLSNESTPNTILFKGKGSGKLTVYCTWTYFDIEGEIRSLTLSKTIDITVV